MRIRLVALAACVSACRPGAEPPPCNANCVEHPCADSYPTPLSPSGGTRTGYLTDLSADCVITGTDDLGRSSEYLCYGSVPTIVTYHGTSDLVATITQTDQVQNGVVQTTVVEYEWRGDGNLEAEQLRVLHDGVPTGREHSWTWTYDGDVIVSLDERNAYDDGDGGDFSDARFTGPDGIERSLLRQEWNSVGQMQRSVLSAGEA